jgi:catechol 2,3-dioxygenase-like lactoylglutathione lyase family enzyme
MDTPFTVEKLDHIVLRVRDLQKSIAFYEMFGGRPAASSGAINTPMALGPATRVLLHHEPDYVPRPGNLQHFALELSAKSVDDVLACVREHGAEPFDGPMSNGRGHVQFRVLDPDENEIEIRVRER